MSTAMTATILDFDTRELMGVYSNKARVNDNRARQAQLHAARLSAVLQTTIELSEILQIFYQEFSRLMSVDGLSYEHKAHDYKFLLGQMPAIPPITFYKPVTTIWGSCPFTGKTRVSARTNWALLNSSSVAWCIPCATASATRKPFALH